jgi:outer membrane protein OmpA-like peptidoglycan-associated protein
MKKLLTILCLVGVLVFVQSEAFAQTTQSLTFRTLWNNYINPAPAWENWDQVFTDAEERGVEVSYGRRIHKNTWLVVPLKFGTVQYANSNRTNLIGNLDVLLQNNLTSSKSLVIPSIHLGLGSTWDFDKDEFDFNIPAGAGLNLRILPNLYLSAQTQYRFSIENRPGWQHGLGLTVLFGEEDRDGDGVSDSNDQCPDVPGVKDLMGCPDRDGDGVTDEADKCPDVAGLANLMGCPDRDGDGITDNDDNCPDLKGPVSTKGCPDRDDDGIVDSADDCPDVKGLAAMKGCPDADNDGITDAQDKCPREAGPAATMGCPDRDGDGVADKDDACPDKKGDSAHKGCPDSDGDGIYDDTDNCPDKPGVAALRGCPEVKKEEKAKLERTIKLVQFETAKVVLLKKSYAALDEVVSVMNANVAYSLNINGHTDDVGDDKRNQDLSERRAKACYDYLVSKGIAASRITSAGFGETKPISDNKTAAGREQNRRVEIELYVK